MSLLSRRYAAVESHRLTKNGELKRRFNSDPRLLSVSIAVPAIRPDRYVISFHGGLTKCHVWSATGCPRESPFDRERGVRAGATRPRYNRGYRS